MPSDTSSLGIMDLSSGLLPNLSLLNLLYQVLRPLPLPFPYT